MLRLAIDTSQSMATNHTQQLPSLVGIAESFSFSIVPVVPRGRDNERGEWAFGVGASFVTALSAQIIGIGWGFADDEPIRPWPSKYIHKDGSIAWNLLGFFVQFGKWSR